MRAEPDILEQKKNMMSRESQDRAAFDQGGDCVDPPRLRSIANDGYIFPRWSLVCGGPDDDDHCESPFQTVSP